MLRLKVWKIKGKQIQKADCFQEASGKTSKQTKTKQNKLWEWWQMDKKGLFWGDGKFLRLNWGDSCKLHIFTTYRVLENIIEDAHLNLNFR